MTARIESITIDKLIAHPENSNRMAQVTFNKLVSHIKTTGNYEPLIVRRHLQEDGCYELINGHHRAKALAQLGIDHADCIVWDVDDDQVRVLLATLNRLGGSDDLDKKVALIKALSEKYDSRTLACKLPDSRKTIERLKDMSCYTKAAKTKPFLNAMVFFLTGQQKNIVEAALAEAIEPGTDATIAQKRAWAIVKILREAKR